MHQVKIFDPRGNLKKIISAEEVQKKYWLSYDNNLAKQRPKGRKKPKPTEPIDLPPENEY